MGCCFYSQVGCLRHCSALINNTCHLLLQVIMRYTPLPCTHSKLYHFFLASEELSTLLLTGWSSVSQHCTIVLPWGSDVFEWVQVLCSEISPAMNNACNKYLYHKYDNIVFPPEYNHDLRICVALKRKLCIFLYKGQTFKLIVSYWSFLTALWVPYCCSMIFHYRRQQEQLPG